MKIDKNSDYTTYDYSGVSSTDSDDAVKDIENSKAFKEVGKEFDSANEKGKQRRSEIKNVLVLSVLCFIALC